MPSTCCFYFFTSPIPSGLAFAPTISSNLLSLWLTTTHLLPNLVNIFLFLYFLISNQRNPVDPLLFLEILSSWFLGYYFLLVSHLIAIYVSSFSNIQSLNFGIPDHFSCFSELFVHNLIQYHGSNTI